MKVNFCSLKGSYISFLICFFLFFISGNVFPQCFQVNYDSALAIQAKGEFEKSIEWAKKSLECAQKEFKNQDSVFGNIFFLLGENYYYSRMLDSSLYYFEKESEIRKSTYGDSSFIYGNTQANLGLLYFYFYKYEIAEECYSKAEKIFLNSGKDSASDYGELTLNMATLYSTSRRFELAEKYYRISAKIIKKHFPPPHFRWVSCQNNLAIMFLNQGKFNQAEKIFLQISKLLSEAERTREKDYVKNLINLGTLYFQSGKIVLARDLIEKSIRMLDSNNRSYLEDISFSYNFLSQIYLTLGEYKLAEEYASHSLEIRKKIYGENHPIYINSANTLANFYYATGNYKSAKQWYYLILEKQKKIVGEKDNNYVSILNNLGIVLQDMGEWDDARKAFEKTVELRKGTVGENHYDYFGSQVNLAGVYSDMGDFEKAEENYYSGIKGMENVLGKSHPNYATALFRMAQMLYHRERLDESEKYLDESITVMSELYNEYNTKMIEVFKLKALISQSKNDFDKAGRYWNKTLQGCLWQIDKNFSNLSDKERSNFWNLIQKSFEEYNTFIYVRSGWDITRIHTDPFCLGTLFDFRLKTKALLLNNTGKIKNRILNSGDSVLINHYKKWKQQKEYMAYLYSRSKEELSKDGINLDSLENTANSMEKKISLLSEDFTSQKRTGILSWKNVRSTLKNEEAALEIIRFRKYSYASLPANPSVTIPALTDTIIYAILIITKKTKEHPEIVFLENGSMLEKEFFINYQRTIKNKVDDKDSYNNFWKPLVPKLSGIKKVYISPDGIFNLINLSAIRNPETGNYLLDEYEIHNLTSIRSLGGEEKLKKNRKTSKKIFAIGDIHYQSGFLSEDCTADLTTGNLLPPLPGTQKEINDLQTMIPDKGFTLFKLSGDSAKEDTIKSLRNPWILHIATHGYFLSGNQIMGNKIYGIDSTFYHLNPLLKSGLFFAGSDLLPYYPDSCKNTIENGILTSYEVMNLNLDSTQLVVLSACETGLGDVQNGEGVYGLYRAFRVAGANKIIMSLWKINDWATQELMKTFYSIWNFKGDPGKPFREAQLEMKERFKYPYFWGAFILVE